MLAPLEERSFFFPCEGERLLGIITLPAEPSPVGVLIVVGGPQYRVGNHRQFVHLARHLARSGIVCMRFDYRGMGDGSGALRPFEAIDSDLDAAVKAFLVQCPRIQSVVLWGLCDGASAACFYAAGDPRVRGVVLVNPWVRTEVGQARTFLRHYYLQRLFSRDFWQHLFSGRIDLHAATRSLLRAIGLAFEGRREVMRAPVQRSDAHLPLPGRMARRLQRFDGGILVILSGNDYTAKEFCDVRLGSEAWTKALDRARTEVIEGADHTFSTQNWKALVAEITAAWVTRLHAPNDEQSALEQSHAPPSQSSEAR